MRVKKIAGASTLLKVAAFMPRGVGLIPFSILASMSLNAAVEVPGYLKYEYFPGQTRPAVEAGTVTAPGGYAIGATVGSAGNALITTAESGTNFAENYANRISGIFTPSTTGNYVFFIAADDDSDLFLSTDETPANKKLIAQEAGWSGVRVYNNIGGGSTIEGKRSDLFPNSQWPGAVAGAGATINLTAGKKYYIEAVHHEGGGGDNLAITYKLDTDADPTDGDAPAFKTSEISALIEAGNPTITIQPVGGTAYTGTPFSMFVVDGSNGAFPVGFQWRKNGTAITGATSSTYSIGAAASTDAGNYDVVLSAYNASGGIVTVTSAPPAVVTVKDIATGFATGKLKYEYFPGATRDTVYDGSAAPNTGGSVVGSDKNGFVDSAESGTGFADNYANRISGYFIPPANGNYIFLVAGDDDSDFFLSTDETPANKKLIAQESGWSGVRNYQTVGGGSTAEDKRSDTFASTEWPDGNTITLTGGKKYYIEIVHHEGGGGDNLAATYRAESEPDSLVASGTAPRLTGNVIGADGVPSIFNIKFGTISDKTLSFSVSDVASSVLDPATVKVSVDGQSSVGTLTAGTKTGTITPYTLTFNNPLPYNSSHVYRIEATDTGGQLVFISGSASVGAPFFPTANLPGPAAAKDAFGVRFMYNIKDAQGARRQVTSLPTIFGMIADSANTNTFKGKIFDTTSQVIDYNGGALLPDNNPYPTEVTDDVDPGGDPALSNWNGEDFINLNIAHIDVQEESDYTFDFHSDDGFAFRIRGAAALSVNGNGQLDPLDPEAVVHPADTGDSNTRAVYHLKKGIYRLEYFWWERGGGDFGELAVAKGAFGAEASTDTWVGLGSPTFTSIKLTDAAPTINPGGNGGTGDRITGTLSGTTLTVAVVGGGAGTVEGSTDLKAWTTVGPAPQNISTTGTPFRFFRVKK